MRPRIDLITILTDDVPALAGFYRDVLGLPVQDVQEGYTEFAMEGVRFAICSRTTMAAATGHTSYEEARRGQVFELAFPCETVRDLDLTYAAIVAKGVIPIQPPTTMPWGHRTAFFADPDGNIHELFAAP